MAGTWLRAVSDADQAPEVLDADNVDGPDEFVLPPLTSAQVPAALERALRDLGPVRRWRNPSLWDAVATAIIRQVISADQARAQHRRLRQTFGATAQSPHGPVHALPTPQAILKLEVEDLAAIGLAFKAPVLLAAADAYLLHGAKWTALPAASLFQELHSVPRIGPWTAGAAVADFTHDWSLYPHGDLAVRKWARTAAPSTDWPTDEKQFATRWRQITGAHLAPLTLFTLAWGRHHGGSP
ncbi:hypothetical protein GCM10010191_14760 [Actinomadura vinacea]|uniref:DNA-3-methyladenine glycosylase 2 family protein n=1 Tax=Actinomadura vinacea TaxID=115336 RepID=A0ABN3IMT5_9ACTN